MDFAAHKAETHTGWSKIQLQAGKIHRKRVALEEGWEARIAFKVEEDAVG